MLACVSTCLWGLPKPQAVPGNPASAAPPANPVGLGALDKTKSSLPRINVWRIGGPQSENNPDADVPPDLERSAEKLGYTIRIHAFDEDFSQTIERLLGAFAENQEPDILVSGDGRIRARIQSPPFSRLDNGQVVQEVTRSLVSLRPGTKGRGEPWEYIFPTSRNYLAARSLALQFPGCSERMTGSELAGDLRTVFERIGGAYLQGPEASREFNDPDRFQTEEVNRNPQAEGHSEHTDLGQEAAEVSIPGWGFFRNLVGVQVQQMTACGYWGNEHLAFVPIFSTYESKYRLGWISALLVLRNHDGEWRLLAGNTDIGPWFGLSPFPKLASLIQNPWIPEGYPAPANLLAPDDGKAPVPPTGAQFGNFVWKPSGSGNVIAQVLEVAHNSDARLFIRFTSGNTPTSEQFAIGQLPTTHTLWRWRVWSVSDTGAVSFSESRSFPN